MFALYVRVMVAIGARRAEVCGLRWSDVDFDAGTITVMRSYTVIPGVSGDRPTKTRSARTVTLDPVTVDGLRTAWRTACSIASLADVDAEVRRTGYVFGADPLGQTALRPDVANAKWARVRKAANLDKQIRLHDLRHFQATQLLDAGVPVPTVAARLGHADGTTTMKIYAHRTKRADEFAAAVVAGLLDDPG